MSTPEIQYTTRLGIPYFTAPGAIITAETISHPYNIAPFLQTFPKENQFDDYLQNDTWSNSGESVIKQAGQLCYASFGPKRTKNNRIQEYFDHIQSSGHFSVIEHASVSVLCYGVSRSLTAELTRHRHFSFSQISQRYVNEKVLRFVERPEYQADPVLHSLFEARIEQTHRKYTDLIKEFTKMKEIDSTLTRKKIQQASRGCLTNETEAPLIVTGNLRTWREFFNKRGSVEAEIEIRNLAIEIYKLILPKYPHILKDFTIISLSDGTQELKSMSYFK